MTGRLAVKRITLAAAFLLLSIMPVLAGQWEKQGEYYFLAKDDRSSFSAAGLGANKFTSKYLRYDGIDFLVRGVDSWQDYGRLDLTGNKIFSLPLGAVVKVDELHLLAGGNVGNRYEHDSLLKLYGDNYYYAVITVIFAYQDGAYSSLSVPVFWDWFRLPSVNWSKDGAGIKYAGANPARKDSIIFHASFANPRPAVPVRDILITDSWISDYPYSEIFALTVKSPDAIVAAPRKDVAFKAGPASAAAEPADAGTEWDFDSGLDGWVTGSSPNWDADASWKEESYGKKGVVSIPACGVGGDKFSWLEKKIVLPAWDKITLRFSRHSALQSEQDKQWSDGLLKVIVKAPGSQETVYEKLYSGEWSPETADLSKFKGQTVIVRFENHGAGRVKLTPTTSPVCDGEEALIDFVSITH